VIGVYIVVNVVDTVDLVEIGDDSIAQVLVAKAVAYTANAMLMDRKCFFRTGFGAMIGVSGIDDH
jgi:hypothetical protein